VVSSQFGVPYHIEFCLSPLFRNLKYARYKSGLQTLEGIPLGCAMLSNTYYYNVLETYGYESIA
jgi:hypothetical protein